MCIFHPLGTTLLLRDCLNNNVKGLGSSLLDVDHLVLGICLHLKLLHTCRFHPLLLQYCLAGYCYASLQRLANQLCPHQ